MDKKDLYWLAGLLEGEGSFQKPSPSQPTCPRITLHMTDLDIIQRVATLFGRNYIFTEHKKKEHWKDSYRTLIKSRKAIVMMRELYPIMGERRQGQIVRAIGEKPTSHHDSTEEDWFYWLAGLLEGEGAFMKSKSGRASKSRISIRMTDKDIILRAAELMQAKYYGPYHARNKTSDAIWKPHYDTNLWGEQAIEMMKRLRPYMGLRRQQQIDDVIAAYDPKPRVYLVGESHHQSKLTADDVRAIKQRLTEGSRGSHLAKEYGVDPGLIWQIKAGRIWAHIPWPDGA